MVLTRFVLHLFELVVGVLLVLLGGFVEVSAQRLLATGEADELDSYCCDDEDYED